MEDIQRLFEDNQGKGVEIVLRGDRGLLSGIVENAHNNHVVIKSDRDVYYILYQQIVYVRRLPQLPPGQK